MAVTLKTLHAQLDKKCRAPELAAKDIHKVILFYPDLRPAMTQYIFPDGAARELMNLSGTIPITYRGSSYNIPIEIWIMDTHPYNPPLCYVKPTSDMKIKHNRNVDQNGRIYLPYLTEWSHNTSDLLECCQIMALMFGEEPPVYSKKPSSGRASQVSPTYSSGGENTVGSYSMPMPFQQPSNNPSYPSYPPIPGSVYPQQPYPAYPPTRGSVDQTSAYPPAYNPARNSYPAYNQPTNGPAYPSASPSYGPFTPVADQNASRIGTITDEHIRASLLSGVEEKLGRRLNEIAAQAQDEITSLTKTHDELERGRRTLDEIFERLDKEERTVDKNIQVLMEKNSELRSVVDKASVQESFDVDEAVVPTAPLYKQLLNAYAEESALEDAMYYIGEALRKGVIDLDVFLKQMRELSRKQFVQRALIQKCRSKAGLP